MDLTYKRVRGGEKRGQKVIYWRFWLPIGELSVDIRGMTTHTLLADLLVEEEVPTEISTLLVDNWDDEDDVSSDGTRCRSRMSYNLDMGTSEEIDLQINRLHYHLAQKEAAQVESWVYQWSWR